MKHLRMAVIGLALSGCSLFQAERPMLTADYGASCLVYADAKAAYVLLAKAVTDACKAGKLGADTCAAAAKIHDRVQLEEASLRSVLADPKRPVDWEKVTALLVSIIWAAMKLAL